jgi:hypothetical protein
MGKKFLSLGWSVLLPPDSARKGNSWEKPNAPKHGEYSTTSCCTNLNCQSNKYFTNLLNNSVDIKQANIDNRIASIVDGAILLPNNNTLNIKILIDTGSLNRDFISQRLSDLLAKQGIKEFNDESTKICSPLSNICEIITNSTNFNIAINNKSNNNNTSNNKTSSNKILNLNTKKLNNFPLLYDVIIGLKTIINYNLINFFKERFTNIVNNIGDEESDQLETYAPLESNSPNPNYLVNDASKLTQQSKESEQIFFEDFDIQEKPAAIDLHSYNGLEDKSISKIPLNIQDKDIRFRQTIIS